MDEWIGVLSDTHGLVRPETIEALSGCSHIVHAGDYGSDSVLVALRRIAPVSVVRGNTDFGPTAADLPEQLTVECLGLRVHLVHDFTELGVDPYARGIDVVVSGHTHKPKVEQNGRVLFLNPGSAGPRRMRLPTTLARLWPGMERPEAEIVYLI